MEIDKLPIDLECVEDDFEEGAHEKLDRNIRAVFRFTPEYFDELLPMVLSAIVFKSGGRLLAKYTNDSECETIIKNEPRLRNMLLDGWTNGYKSVRLLSKDLSGLNDCTSNAPIVELLRPSGYQSKVSWRSY